jgi:hypothetical protein
MHNITAQLWTAMFVNSFSTRIKNNNEKKGLQKNSFNSNNCYLFLFSKKKKLFVSNLYMLTVV